ncbi:hypothetical protein V6N13_089900 [Hibiscus sabdariffa]
MTRTPPTVGTTLPRPLEGKLPRKLRGITSCLWPMSSTSRPAKFPSPIGPLQISPKICRMLHLSYNKEDRSSGTIS